MSRSLVLSLLLVVSQQALAADVVTTESVPEGAWTAISAQRDGASASELIGHRIEFTGERFRISNQGTLLFGGTFTTKPDEIPAQIDFKVEEGDAKGKSWLGIYKIENGALTVCDNAPSPAAPRQRDFEAPKGSGYVCLTFER